MLADGQEVHYSNSRTGTFEFSWTMRGNHVLKVLCHATPQVTQVTGNNGFRQYDLSVDGQSFFSMPKVYELGIRGPVSQPRVPVPVPVNKHSNQPGEQAYFQYKDQMNSTYNGQTNDTAREEEDLRRAIQNSINESRAHLQRQSAPTATATRAVPPVAAPAPAPVVDLIDMTALTISK